jgi:hypothetical protein
MKREVAKAGTSCKLFFVQQTMMEVPKQEDAWTDNRTQNLTNRESPEVLPLSEVKGDRQKNYDGNVATNHVPDAPSWARNA